MFALRVTVWRSCRTLREPSLAGPNRSLEQGFEGYNCPCFWFNFVPGATSAAQSIAMNAVPMSPRRCAEFPETVSQNKDFSPLVVSVGYFGHIDTKVTRLVSFIVNLP